jgi:hypothetical protein
MADLGVSDFLDWIVSGVTRAGHWVESTVLGLHMSDDSDSDGVPPTEKAPTPNVPSGGLAVPTPTSEAWASRAPTVAERLSRLWSEGTGDPGPVTEGALQMLIAHARLESGVAEPGGGGGWTGDMVGSGNLGARQGNQAEQGGTPQGPGYRLVRFGDSRPTPQGQKAYSVLFRYYVDDQGRPAGDWAALDFLKSLQQFSSPAGAVVRAAQAGNVEDYATALYHGHYYGGFSTDPATAINAYANGIRKVLPAAAAALGHATVGAA